MRTQAELELLVEGEDALGHLDRLIVIVFQDLVDGLFDGDALVVQHARALFAQHDGGHAEHGVLQDLLVRQLSLPDLFIKPTHLSPPQSLAMSSV